MQTFTGDLICAGFVNSSMILLSSKFQNIFLNMLLWHIYRQNKLLVESLSRPTHDSKDLSFPTKYAQPFHVQFLACLWKQQKSYWRNPQYTAVRFFYTVIISLMFGTICWRFGSRRFSLSLSFSYTCAYTHAHTHILYVHSQTQSINMLMHIHIQNVHRRPYYLAAHH